MGSTLKIFSHLHRSWNGVLRERFFCILRKHGDENVVDYFEFGAVGSSNIDKNIPRICTDLRMV